NESNYHIFLDDFVNGLLDEEQELAFVEFLEKHPGILDGEELETPAITLDASFKNALKKEIPSDLSHTDELLIASLEGDLSEKQEKELEVLLSINPSLEQDRKLFALTRLVADNSIVYPGKKDLKKYPIIPLYLRWTSAAAAILILGFFFFRWGAIPQSPVATHPTENGNTQTDSPKRDMPVQKEEIASPSFLSENKTETSPIRRNTKENTAFSESHPSNE